MATVTELHKPRPGDQMFMLCPCTDEGEAFLVVAAMQDEPFIMALVCPNCEQEIPVVNGYVGRES